MEPTNGSQYNLNEEVEEERKLNLSDYTEYFQSDGNHLYVRRDFINRLKELKGFSLRQLLGIMTTDDSREKWKLIKAFESGKPIRNPSRNNYKKQPIPKDLRWTVWERDDFTCQICGSRRNLTIDHIYPESKGGELTLENAQTLCKSCNSRKNAK